MVKKLIMWCELDKQHDGMPLADAAEHLQKCKDALQCGNTVRCTGATVMCFNAGFNHRCCHLMEREVNE